MNVLIDLFKKYREIIMYMIMGFATTAVNWVAYAACVSIFHIDRLVWGFDIDVLISNVIAWTVAVIFAYVTNKLLVFESYSWKLSFVIKEFVLFISARLATGVLEILGVPFLVGLGLNQTILGIEGMVSKVLVSVIVVILNYVFSKLIIFKKEKVTE